MIKEFTIGFSRTVNLGNYESARVEAAVKYELEVVGDENLEEAINFAQQELKSLLEKTWKAQLKTITKDTLK